MKLMIPILGLLVGGGIGVGAGLTFAPEKTPDPANVENAASLPEEPVQDEQTETAMLSDQFIIPVVDHDRVKSLVVMSIGLELRPGASQTVLAQEARLRDTFLQVLFEHANMGGFEGAFTNARNLDLLRSALFKAATQQLSEDIRGVLITDLARQDV